MHRRQFLTGVGGALGAAATVDSIAAAIPGKSAPCVSACAPLVDFRYAPLQCQHLFSLPDDAHLALIGERGDLRYGNPGGFNRDKCFPEVVQFYLNGMASDRAVRQRLEAPGVAIIHTRLAVREACLELTTFATNEPGEGRVDNVILEVRPRTKAEVQACPLVELSTKRKVALQSADGVKLDGASIPIGVFPHAMLPGGASLVKLDGTSGRLFMAVDTPVCIESPTGVGTIFRLKPGRATNSRPLRYFLRFPREGQDFEKIKAGLAKPDALLAAAREHWRRWKPFLGEVSWRLPSPYSDFLIAGARSLWQVRNKVHDRTVFGVGPTNYNFDVIGLQPLDTFFLLEAARYLGYDAASQEHLQAMWEGQRDSGEVSAGQRMWKDTGVAAFTLVRQAELAQDWKYFRDIQPKLLKALRFLAGLRDQARKDGSVSGRYGLLPPGFSDGGVDGIRPELSNTLWVLAGFKAATEAGAALKIAELEPFGKFYGELRASFFAAARRQMRRHPAGFDYLPMLMKEDPQWSAQDEAERPRPQAAQWPVSNAIAPGGLFDRDDPIVKGHFALMRACTQEDIPAETGWIADGVCPFFGAWVAQAYLWAGQRDWADAAFHGFLNHATPLYSWVEEQPLRGSVLARYNGDMPDNDVTVECIRYLRHMLAFEDGANLRLLAGIGANQLAAGEPYAVKGTPTRFGRLNLELEPHGGRWRLKFERPAGPAPGAVQIPAVLGDRARLSSVSGAKYRSSGGLILVEPAAPAWTAEWS